MRIFRAVSLALGFVLGATACSGSGAPAAPVQKASPLPSPTNNGTVPSGVAASGGYGVTVFATTSGSTKPDSLVQIGSSVFVGVGDDVGPDGTPGPSGATQTQILQYDLTGKLLKTYQVPGHNDGLMRYDGNTLWAMSNEDSNAKLTIVNVSSGTEQSYSPQASLVDASGGLPHGGGLDDMQLVNGKVYVSASNGTVSTTAACPATSSTPGCPNGVATVPLAYALSLNADGTTFNLVPTASSGVAATNMVSGSSGSLNVTDADSETVTPDGNTLIVDGQQDSELTYVASPGASPTLSYLPLTLAGAATAVDDTRFVPAAKTFLLAADTPNNTIYRIDASFTANDMYASAPTSLAKLDPKTEILTSVVTGLGAPHGLLFVTAP